MNAILLMAIALSAFIITFASGFLILRAATFFSHAECWAFSGAAGCALLSTIAFAAFLIHTSHPAFVLVSLAPVMLLCLWVIRLRRFLIFPFSLPFWMPYVFVFWLGLIAFQCITPVYGGAFMYGDWWMHFDIAQFYLGLRPPDVHYFDVYGIPSRTPLFNLYSAYFLAIFGNQFAVYQVVAIIPGIALIGAAASLVSSRKAVIMLILFFLNPFMVTMMLYPWPKVLAAAYVLASLYFYIRWGSEPQPGPRLAYLSAWALGLGLAILAHSAAVLYALGIFLDAVFRRRSRATPVSHLFLAALVTACVIAPWLFWSMRAFGPLAWWYASPTGVTRPDVFSSLWWVERGQNLAGTLLPLRALEALGGHMRNQWLWWNAWLRFYYAVLPGACTLTVKVLLCTQLRRHFDAVRTLPLRIFGIVIVIAFLGTILLEPGANSNGLAGENMTVIVALALIVAAHVVGACSLREQRLIAVVAAMEFLVSRGIHTLWDAQQSMPVGANLDLKEQNRLLFARDVVGPGWIVFACILIAGYTFILWRFLRYDSLQTGDAKTAVEDAPPPV